MPSEKLHRELNRLMRVDPEAGLYVQKLMDAGSKTYGGRHREMDPTHSFPGAVAELARRGVLNSDTAHAALSHLVQDRMGDMINRANPIRGPLRQPSKAMAEALLTTVLSRRRR